LITFAVIEYDGSPLSHDALPSGTWRPERSQHKAMIDAIRIFSLPTSRSLDDDTALK
jgi:hypothetical protein